MFYLSVVLFPTNEFFTYMYTSPLPMTYFFLRMLGTHGQRSVGFFSIPHLLWHEVSVYNGNLRSTHTCCLAFVQWSCHYLFLILRTVAVGIRPTTFCMWGGRSNRLHHRGGCIFWDLHGAKKNVMYFDPVQFFFHWQVAKSITLNFNFNTSDQSNKEEK